MTPEERAKSLASLLGGLGSHSQMLIAAEIRAAVEEEQQLRADWNYRIECLEKQLAEAYETAAKIAEDTQTPGDPFDLPKVAAMRIRARAAEVGK